MSGGVVVQPPLQLTGSPIAAAQRLLRSAARGITPIGTVMSSIPTFTRVGNQSAINGAAQAGNGVASYFVNDSTKVEALGVLAATTISGAAGYADQTVTKLTGLTGLTRRSGHGTGIRFATDASTFDVALNTSGNSIIMYATSLSTGIRARSAANDHSAASGSSYYQWDFGSVDQRVIELYTPCSLVSSTPILYRGGLNVPTTASIWRSKFPDEARVFIISDSWGDFGNTAVTNPAKLLAPDYIGERLGVTNLISASQGGSGFLNDSSGSGTYIQRITNGDIDISRVGVLDAVIMWGSINDKVQNNAAWTDAACQTACQATVALIMQKQPNALIFVFGPEIGQNSVTPQSRFDAIQAGAIAAAAGAARVMYIDNSPAGENVLFGTVSTGNISLEINAADPDHLNNFGNQNWGRRIGTLILNAIRDRFAL